MHAKPCLYKYQHIIQTDSANSCPKPPTTLAIHPDSRVEPVKRDNSFVVVALMNRNVTYETSEGLNANMDIFNAESAPCPLYHYT